MSLYHSRGQCYPLGPSFLDNCVNVAVYCPQPANLSLRIGDEELPMHRTGDYCHVALGPAAIGQSYALILNEQKLLDPYAKILSSGRSWGSGQRLPEAILMEPESFDWQGVKAPRLAHSDLVIYEMHVRGFTRGGGFLDVIERLPYLRELGINAIELLPVTEFNECEAKPWNFWGYSPLHFFAPMGRYAKAADFAAPIREFQTMVRECHREGIEVIVDVVYNHTAERDRSCPTSSLRGLAESSYYHIETDGSLANYSGCGNSLNADSPVCAQLIIDSLRFWAAELGVDGFRFDLASILTRGQDGNALPRPPLLERIETDPVLSGCKLIAEAWDAAGLHQVGEFSSRNGRWSEWNDQFRDTVRRFLRGEPLAAECATRMAGSADLFGERDPHSSINFVTAHDGFSLADLVSYEQKSNAANGEQGRDGSDNNLSWNCGVEGTTEDAEVLKIRRRQQRNFLLALTVAQGIPMLRMGDECGLSQGGNNNSWCHDELNWFPQDPDDELIAYVSQLLKLRRRYPLFGQEKFWTEQDISWHQPSGAEHDWENELHFLGMWLRGAKKDDDLYVAFNASGGPKEIRPPWNAEPISMEAWSSLVAMRTPEAVLSTSWQSSPDLDKKLAREPSDTEARSTQGPAT